MSGGARRGGDTRLLAALVSGSTVEQAATAAHMSPATAYRRMRHPAFRSALSEARARLVESVVGVLASSAADAAASLSRLATDADSEAVRVSAARAVLDQLRAFRDHAELEERLARLEGMVRAD